MQIVKALRSFNKTPQGSPCEIGETFDVEDTRATELVQLGLVEIVIPVPEAVVEPADPAPEPVVAQPEPAAAEPEKAAPEPENKIAPEPQNKARRGRETK